MRRGSWLVVIAISLAACGIEVVGVTPNEEVTPGVDAGKSSSSGSSGSTTSSSGSITEGGATIDVFVPTVDAGAAEVVMDQVQNLTSITIAGNRLVVGRSDAEALTLDLGPPGKSGTIPKIKNARALMASGNDVFFVGQLDDNSGNIGHWNADGSDDGDTHSNEPPGRDLFLEGILAFGSYKDHVVSYVAKDFTSVQDRSDKNGTPLGVVATATDVYWVDDTRSAVMKDSRTADPPQPPSTVKSGLDHPTSLAVVGLNIYVATATEIMRVAPSVETVAGGLSKPMALTPDKDTLYWIDASAGFLKRQPVGKSVETIGTLATFAEFRPRLIDFKDENVYWGSPNEGRVYRRKK